MALPLAFAWTEFAQQVTSGLAAGAIYASLALALVLIYQTTNVVNFAQGEMATFTTYVAWSLMHHGLGYWPAFVLTLLIAFGTGVTVERVLIRPVEHRPEIVIVILTIGMFIAINGLVGWIFGPEVKAFDSPFPNRSVVVGGLVIGVVINLLGAYVNFVGQELRLPTALAVLLLVLVIRPSGLFGRVVVRKV